MEDVNGTQLYYTIHYVSILARTLGREAALQVYRQQDKSIHVCTTHSKTNGRDQQEDRKSRETSRGLCRWTDSHMEAGETREAQAHTGR